MSSGHGENIGQLYPSQAPTVGTLDTFFETCIPSVQLDNPSSGTLSLGHLSTFPGLVVRWSLQRVTAWAWPFTQPAPRHSTSTTPPEPTPKCPYLSSGRCGTVTEHLPTIYLNLSEMVLNALEKAHSCCVE